MTIALNDNFSTYFGNLNDTARFYGEKLARRDSRVAFAPSTNPAGGTRWKLIAGFSALLIERGWSSGGYATSV